MNTNTSIVSRQVARWESRKPRHRDPLNLWLVDRYVDAGFPIFLGKPDKTPSEYYPNGFKGATLDADRCKWQLRERPDDLVLLPTRGFGTVDIDLGPDGTARSTFERLKVTLGGEPIPIDLVGRTRSGGAHIFLAFKPGVAVRTVQDDPVEGVDLRGHTATGEATGYIVAPGNRHPAGGEWAFSVGTHDDFLERRFPRPGRRLLAIVSLKKADRGLIAAHPDLRAAIDGADAERWPALIAEWRRAHDRGRVVLAGPDATALRRMGCFDLNAEAEAVRSLDTGRRRALWRSACRLARYVANGALTEKEVVSRLSGAFVAAGGPGGKEYAEGCILRALARGADDPAPPIPRRFREEAAR